MRTNKSTNTQQENNEKNAALSGDTVEVLYQKLGDRWFAFSLIDNEVFVCPVTEEEMNAARAKSIKGATKVLGKIVGNS